MNYPHTSRAFTINGKEHLMYKHTLLLLSKIEDENIFVSYSYAVDECTNMEEPDMDILNDAQFEEIYESILEFSKPDEPADNDSNIKAIEVIASLMNRGHMDAQYYRTDFVEVIIGEYMRNTDDKKEDPDEEEDNETKMKGLFDGN